MGCAAPFFAPVASPGEAGSAAAARSVLASAPAPASLAAAMLSPVPGRGCDPVSPGCRGPEAEVMPADGSAEENGCSGGVSIAEGAALEHVGALAADPAEAAICPKTLIAAAAAAFGGIDRALAG
jgi:hypothetical protein